MWHVVTNLNSWYNASYCFDSIVITRDPPTFSALFSKLGLGPGPSPCLWVRLTVGPSRKIIPKMNEKFLLMNINFLSLWELNKIYTPWQIMIEEEFDSIFEKNHEFGINANIYWQKYYTLMPLCICLACESLAMV